MVVEMAPTRRVSTQNKMTGNSNTSPIMNGGGIVIGSKPSVIVHGPMRFLVMDAPRQSNLYLYIRECRKQGVTDLVRVCEPTYDGEVDLHSAGITLHEMEYPDGTSPTKEVLERWLDLVHQRYFRSSGNPDDKNNGNMVLSSSSSGSAANNGSVSSVAPSVESSTIAVHCVAGLGRAPVLVAIALVEFANMDPIEAVSFIRRHRRGAINEKQLNYLEKYKRQWKGGEDVCCTCVIM